MMTDLHIEMRYGLPEFTFDLPDGWQLEPLTKATVDKTVELVLGPESPAAERDRLAGVAFEPTCTGIEPSPWCASTTSHAGTLACGCRCRR